MTDKVNTSRILLLKTDNDQVAKEIYNQANQQNS